MVACNVGPQNISQKQTFSDADVAVHYHHTHKKFHLHGGQVMNRESTRRVTSQLQRAPLKTHAPTGCFRAQGGNNYGPKTSSMYNYIPPGNTLPSNDLATIMRKAFAVP